MKIQILNKHNQPVEGVEVIVLWGNSHSRKTTDRHGIADLGCSGGTAKSISVNGREIRSGSVVLKEGDNPFTLDR